MGVIKVDMAQKKRNCKNSLRMTKRLEKHMMSSKQK